MLAAGEIALFRGICLISYKLNIIPVTWNRKTGKLFICYTSARSIFYITGRIYSVVYLIFSIMRLVPAYKGTGIKYPFYHIMFHLCQVVLHLFTVMFDSVVGIHLEEIVDFYNHLKETDKSLGDKFMMLSLNI